jgi:hypothetical protein
VDRPAPKTVDPGSGDQSDAQPSDQLERSKDRDFDRSGVEDEDREE